VTGWPGPQCRSEVAVLSLLPSCFAFVVAWFKMRAAPGGRGFLAYPGLAHVLVPREAGGDGAGGRCPRRRSRYWRGGWWLRSASGRRRSAGRRCARRRGQPGQDGDRRLSVGRPVPVGMMVLRSSENRSLQSRSSLASARRVSSAGTGLAPVPQAKSLHGTASRPSRCGRLRLAPGAASGS
jgi:hypothetical protein